MPRGIYKRKYGIYPCIPRTKKFKEKLKLIFSGDKNHFYGKNHLKKSLKKMSIAKKGKTWEEIYGKTYAKEFRKKMKILKSGKKLSKKTKKKIGESHKGEKNYNWKGGIHRDKHNSDFHYSNWRNKVFKRDNYTCQECGKRGCYIEAHHIKSWAKYPKLRYNINNGVTLCEKCHKKIHMRKGQIKKKRCVVCHRWMTPVKDSIAHTYTGYLWHCDCMPKGVVISIG